VEKRATRCTLQVLCLHPLNALYKEIEEKARKIGLEVNEGKTKYMIMSTSESRRKPQDLKVEGKLFTGVSGFKYLGSMINNGNRNDNCIKERITSWNQGLFRKS
jgi:hypothetical protein